AALTAISTAAVAATTTTAAAGTFFTRFGHVDSQCTAINGGPVESVDCLLSFFRGAHGDEAEASSAAADAVHHQIGFENSAVSGESILKVVFSGVEGKVPNKQFVTHLVMFSR